MGVFSGPEINEDGLVLVLDTANTKSYGGSGTTWTDLSGKGNNGTLTNGPLHSQGPFPGAGYVDFDGTGDYLDITSNLQQTGEFTIEFWFYANSISQDDTIYTWGNSATYMNPCRFKSTTNLGFYKYGVGLLAETGANTVQPNQWYHLAVTKNSSNTLSIWLDGVLKDTYAFGSDPYGNTGGVHIGASHDPGTSYDYFDGYISNFRCVSSCLYTSNFTPTKGSLENILNTKLLTCQGSSITDASDSSHTITANGNAAAVYNDVAYFDFDGSNDYVNFGNILNQFPITISAWTKTNSTSENLKVDVVNKYTAASGNGYRLAFSSNGISGFYFKNNSNRTNNYDNEYGTVSTNTWYHIVMTVDSSGIKFYINGSLVGSNTWTGTPGAPTTTTNLSLGYYPGNTSGGQYYDGDISQVSIYNKALTASEVAQNFNALRGRYGI